MDKNRELHELLGHDWHLIIYHAESPNIIEYWSCSCDKTFTDYYLMKEHLKKNNPDYAADPRIVLREMRKREDWRKFCMTIGDIGLNDWPLIKVGYVMDTTGKLRDMAIEWLKGG